MSLREKNLAKLQRVNALPPQPAKYRDATAFVKHLTGKVPKEHTVVHKENGESTRLDVKSPVILRTKPVCWGIPEDEIIFGRFFANWLRLRAMPWDDFYTTGSTYVPDARNVIHTAYVENSDCEYLVMLDSDVLPPPDFLERLLDHKKPMVGGWYRKKGDPYPPCVYDYVSTEADGVHWWRIRQTPGEGLEQVDGAGAGCWLMHKDVAVALGKRPYDMNQGGEDLTLCKRLMDLGIPVFVDWSIACAHAGVAIA